MTDNRSPQGVAALAQVRLARSLALASWALAALAPGVAVALAQYTSLVYGLHSPLYTVALLIVCLGLGLALLSWVFSVVVRVRLWRAGYRFEQSTGCGLLIAFLGAIALLVGGGVLAAWGGNSDSQALPALVALGLGVAGVVGGVLGIFWYIGRFMTQGLRESQARHEHLLDVAASAGYDTTAVSRAWRGLSWWVLLDVLGTVVGFLLLFFNPVWVLLLPHLLPLSAIGALVLVLVVGAPLVFVSIRALVFVSERANTLAPEAAVRRYALWAATALTTAFLLMGILVAIGLGFFFFIPLVALIFLPPILRKRSGMSL